MAKQPKGGELTKAGRVYLQFLVDLAEEGEDEERDEEPKGPCYWRLKRAGYIEWTGRAVRLTAAGRAVAPSPTVHWVRVVRYGRQWAVKFDDRLLLPAMSTAELQRLGRSIREAVGDG